MAIPFKLPLNNMGTCPSDNAEVVNQSSFFHGGTFTWDAHRIGWAIAGGCTILVCGSFRMFFPLIADELVDNNNIHHKRTIALSVGFFSKEFYVLSSHAIQQLHETEASAADVSYQTFDYRLTYLPTKNSNLVPTPSVWHHSVSFLSLLPGLYLLFVGSSRYVQYSKLYRFGSRSDSFTVYEASQSFLFLFSIPDIYFPSQLL